MYSITSTTATTSTALLLLLLLSPSLLFTSSFAEDLEPEDLNNANFNLIRGDITCPRTFRFNREDTNYRAIDILADDIRCTGGATLKLTKNPSSGGGALAQNLRRNDDRDDSYEGALSGTSVCSSLSLASGTYFLFFCPDDDIKVNPSKIFGSKTHPLAANSDGEFEFDDGTTYLVLGDKCIYKQASRLEVFNINDGDSACFPASATAELESGIFIPMSQLAIGDSVRTGPNHFSTVFMFSHRIREHKRNFVSIQTASGASLLLSSGHYLYLDGALAAASSARAGAIVVLASGRVDTITRVAFETGEGLYAPHTVSGDIVVGGLLASTYTTAVEPSFAHALLTPLRILHRLGGWNVAILESGGGPFAVLPPRGANSI